MTESSQVIDLHVHSCTDEYVEAVIDADTITTHLRALALLAGRSV